MQSFCPARNHLIECKGDRLATLYAAIEYRAVNQCAVIVYLYTVCCRRFLAFAEFENFVLQPALGFYYAVVQRICLQEFLAFFFGCTIFDTVDSVLDILLCLSLVEHILVFVESVDKALLDEFKVCRNRLDTYQSRRFLLFDACTDLFADIHQLRVLHAAFQCFVYGSNKFFLLVSVAVVCQSIHLDLVAVEQTESIVQAIVIGSKRDGLYFCGAFCRNSLAGLLSALGRSHISRLKERACICHFQHGGVAVQSVHQSLKQHFFIDGPRRILCQSFVLGRLDSHTDVLTYLCCFRQFFLFAVVAVCEGVDKLCYSLVAAIVGELVCFELRSVQVTECIVERVRLVFQNGALCGVRIAARHQCHSGKNGDGYFIHCFYCLCSLRDYSMPKSSTVNIKAA